MRVVPIRTDKILAGQTDILAVIDKFLDSLDEGSVLAVSSKILSLCENNVAPLDADKEDLIKQHADKYLDSKYSDYGHHFTITDNTLIGGAGIDESNSDNQYVLWPRDSQASANDIRKHLAGKYHLENVGVVIVDSTSQPLRRGTTGIALAHSGFLAAKDYRGQPDLFDRPLGVSVANISGGLAASAVLAMGEGAEQTPLAVISEVPFVEFQTADPTDDELSFLKITLEDDLFAPFLTSVDWQTRNS